jgi:hypothetical protein
MLYRTSMPDPHASEPNASSSTLQALDDLTIAPAWLSLALALLASAGLLLAEIASGRLEWLAADTPDGLRNVRLAFGLIALVAYLPTATHYVIRGARRTADKVRPLLARDDANVRAEVDAIGTQPAAAFRWAGWGGVLLALLIPLLIDLPRGEFSYALDQPVETIWHRVATPIVGWWGGRLVYVIGLESRRLSNLASGLRTIDLFDLEPLLPFARQGLTHALLLIGFVSIFAVMSLFEAGLGLTAGLLTLLTLPVAFFGLLLPVRGAHRIIRNEKQRLIAWCQPRLIALQADFDAAPNASVLRELADVLTFRTHLEAVREWPFDVSVVSRFLLYLVIPLGSWAGAALVEHAVNVLLD